jgi:hypothetical protein
MKTSAMSLVLICVAPGCNGTVELSQAGFVSGAESSGAMSATGTAGSVGAAGASSSAGSGGAAGASSSAGSGGAGGGAGGARWAHIFGNSADQFPNMTVADTDGNVYLVGGFYGSVNFGGSNLVSAGDADGFAAKFDANGNHVWSKRFGDASEQTVTDVALGSTGDILMTGYYTGAIDLGGGPLPAGLYDAFIAKLTPDGNHVWSIRYGSAQEYDYLRAIASDPSGDVLVAGYFKSSAQDIVIGKFSGGDGSEVWVKQISASGTQLIFESLETDGAGNVFVAAQFQSTLTLGTTTLTSAGANDVFVAKLDPNGTFLWAKSFGDSADQVAGAVVVDSQGSPVIAGNFQGTLSFDGQGEIVSAGDYDIFIVKLATDGTFQWSKRFGDTARQASLRAAIDEFDNILLTGEMDGLVSFGGDPLQSAGEADLLLVKLDMSGNHLWSKRFGDSDSQIGRGVAVAKGAGWVYMTGYASGATDFGTGTPLLSSGGYDIVLASFNP